MKRPCRSHRVDSMDGQSLSLRVLLLTDTQAQDEQLRRLLGEAWFGAAAVSARHSTPTSPRPAYEHFDVVVLVEGEDAPANALAHAIAEVPIPLITLSTNAEAAHRARVRGAYDALLPHELSAASLKRALRGAIEQRRLETEIARLSLVDTPTGLHSQRAFWLLGEQQLKLARRVRARQLLVYVLLVNAADILEQLGRAKHEQALFDVSNILRRTCRQSDIIAHLEGGEYLVLAIDGADGAGALDARLVANTKVFAETLNRPYRFAIDTATAIVDPQRPCELEELLSQAKAALSRAPKARTESC